MSRGPAHFRLAAATALLVAFWCGSALFPASRARADALLPLEAFPRETLAIETRSARRHVFDAWRADTPEARAQGLMYVRNLRPDQAMIFVYGRAERAMMWMKNTLIPLDMLFVDAGGCIVHVHERATPGSLATIEADGPVELVVELAGGTASTLRIAVGDRVIRPDIGWPGRPGRCATGP